MNTLKLAIELGFVEIIRPPDKEGIEIFQKQELDFLLVIDFETTCWGDGSEQWKGQEIIEFPAVLLELRSGRVLGEYHRYLRPSERPVLAPFCTELTGIPQSIVDDGISLSQCLDEFREWLRQQADMHSFEVTAHLPRIKTNCDLRPGRPRDGSAKKSAAVVTWTDWDIQTCLQAECSRKRLQVPKELTVWIDLKAVFKGHYGRSAGGLAASLRHAGLSFEGQEHSGICDARNTALLARRLARDGCLLRVTSSRAKLAGAVR